MSNAEETVRGLLEPVVAPLGLVLDDVSIRQAGARRVVKIVVDVDLDGIDDDTTPVAPLTLDEVADATRAVDEALEASDALGAAPCTLEVGTPGVSRPLTDPRHYRRNVGRLVKATLADGRQVTGRVMRAGADDVELLVPATRGKDKSPEHTETHPYADLRSAAVQVEFNRPGAVVDLTADDDADDIDDDTDDLGATGVDDDTEES